MITVLHTWSQKLGRHYHLHCIVSGGALSSDGTRWISSKHPKYLFPEFALNKTFRRLFWYGSKDLSKQDAPTKYSTTVKFKGLKDLILEEHPDLSSTEQSSITRRVKLLEDRLYSKPWVVYAKQAFGGPTKVINYLSCYTHRVAISNQRILSHANGMVTFSYKDRKNNDRKRTLCLPESEFASRFLAHVLPVGFMKIRSYGFLANRKKRERLQQLHQLLGVPDISNCRVQEQADEHIEEPDQDSLRTCPQCKKPTLKYLAPVRKCFQRLARNLIWDTS